MFFYYTCPRCDYGLVNIESIFLHDNPAHDDVSPYHIRLQKVQKITSGQTFIDISNLRCNFDLQRSNPVFSQDTLA